MSAKIPSLHNVINDSLADKDAEKLAGNRLHFIKMAAEEWPPATSRNNEINSQQC